MLTTGAFTALVISEIIISAPCESIS